MEDSAMLNWNKKYTAAAAAAETTTKITNKQIKEIVGFIPKCGY